MWIKRGWEGQAGYNNTPACSVAEVYALRNLIMHSRDLVTRG
jgi:hypothetical protein